MAVDRFCIYAAQNEYPDNLSRPLVVPHTATCDHTTEKKSVHGFCENIEFLSDAQLSTLPGISGKTLQRAFNGEGARRAGERWDSAGQRAVYLSSTLSLAAMETFVHLGDDVARFQDVYFEVEISASVSILMLI